MKNLTDFGREVRKLRIDIAMTLREMAAELGVAPAYLSGVETGRKHVGDQLVRNVIELFARRGLDAQHLMDAAARSRKEVRIRFQEAREDQVELAVALARRFQDLSPAQVAKVMNTVTEDPHG